MPYLRQALKQSLLRLAPVTATQFFSARAREHAQRCYAEWGCLELNRRIANVVGAQVQAGPFAGLVLSPETFREHLGPCLLGTYERELHPAWSEILASPFQQIVDIGSKFGYYAVGLARRFPSAEVLAFDTDPWARRAISEMRAANDVRNVSIRKYCAPEWLRSGARPGAFVLSDCEGFESELFGRCDGSLAAATMLIETHDQASPGVTARISAVFAPTHRVTEILSEPRSDIPEAIKSLSPTEQAMALNEYRTYPQKWLWLVPRSARKS